MRAPPRVGFLAAAAPWTAQSAPSGERTRWQALQMSHVQHAKSHSAANCRSTAIRGGLHAMVKELAGHSLPGQVWEENHRARRRRGLRCRNRTAGKLRSPAPHPVLWMEVGFRIANRRKLKIPPDARPDSCTRTIGATTLAAYSRRGHSSPAHLRKCTEIRIRLAPAVSPHLQCTADLRAKSPALSRCSADRWGREKGWS
jgi:hypothetical protein